MENSCKKKIMRQYRLQFGQSAPVLRNQSWQTHKIHIIGGFNNKINSKCKLRSVKYSVKNTIHFSIHDSLCKYSFYSVRISSVGGLHSFLQTSVLLIFRTNSYKNFKRGHWLLCLHSLKKFCFLTIFVRGMRRKKINPL